MATSYISFGREICGDLDAGLRREWLVTNGLGGFASGTLSGIATRRYHGLLVAAFEPPVERTVLVGNMVEWAVYQGKRYPLFAFEYGDGTIDQRGYRLIETFSLDGMLPIWRFALGGALLERRIWMDYEANTTFVRYRLLRGDAPLDLELTPLVTYRDFHTLTSEQDGQPTLQSDVRQVEIQFPAPAHPYRIIASDGAFTPGGVWFLNFLHREERERGQDDRADLYAVGAFHATLVRDESLTLTLTTETSVPSPAQSLQAAQQRQQALLQQANVSQAAAPIQQLVLAADQFIVRRQATKRQLHHGCTIGKTIIAGYHWFNDWGRDTMIALPGLTLATGRPDAAADILRTFADYVEDGLLPNNFPDQSGQIPGYNTVDATLWYVHAIRMYYLSTGDESLIDDLLPTLREIAERHIGGTRYGIAMDRRDGLLRAGQAGMQLTWMDAKIGDRVITPRIGKPVEINALWYNLLRTLAAFLSVRHDPAAARYNSFANQVHASFQRRFWRRERGYLADVVDGPSGDDWTLRPNQIFALALPEPLVDDSVADAVLAAVTRTLLTSYGLRSLSPDDPAYCGSYHGDGEQRDSVYHQGPVWSWLMGAFIEAHWRITRNREAALALLRPFEDHFHDAGLGSVSEIFEGDPPHLPRGAIAQAWGVAEMLRVWRLLQPEANG